MLPVKVSRDPAPSRIKYRLERLWLRPALRRFVHVGLPILAVCAGISAAILDDGIRGATVVRYQELRAQIVAHPGLAVTRYRFPNVRAEVAGRVRDELDLEFPISSLDLDLEDLHRKVASLGLVESATVRLEAGGILEISLTERVPAILWRTDGGLAMVDAGGVVVDRVASRADRGDLMLIAGEGADAVVPEALALFRTAEPIHSRIRALVRVGQRRWDLVLDRDQVIRLPEQEPVAAMARVMALNSAEDILGRDVTVVDMRDARRPILRLSPHAVAELLRLRGLVNGENG